MAELDGVNPIEEPLAGLERRLIDEYLRGAGQDAETLRHRGDAESRALLTQASVYAAGMLSEVESRLHYIRSLRGEE